MLRIILTLVCVSSFQFSVHAEELKTTHHTGHFEKNTSGLKGETSVLVFTKLEDFEKVLGTVPPLMGGKRPNPVPKTAFDGGIVVVVITRASATTAYTDVTATEKDGVVTLTYKATTGAATTANFASPLIVSVAKKDMKSVVFMGNGKETGKVEVK